MILNMDENKINHSGEDEWFDDIMTERVDEKQTKCIFNLKIDELYYTPQEMEENAKKYKDEVIHQAEEITQYQLGEFIGRGWFGVVYRGFNLDTGCIMAIKQVPILKFINKNK